MARLRANLAKGTITNAPLLIGGTTLNSAELPRISAVASPDILVIVLDPNRKNGTPEFLYVTAYDGSATSATVTRAAEDATKFPAREHPAGTEWAHVSTLLDWIVVGAISKPSDINGCVLDLDAAALGLADLASVSSFTDQSSSANHAVQATAAAQPTFRTNILNGLPVVRFDGGDYLVTSTLISLTACTIFAVANRTGGAGGTYTALYSTDKVALMSLLSSPQQWGMYLGGNKASGLSLDATHQMLAAAVRVRSSAPRAQLREAQEVVLNTTGTYDTRAGTGIGGDATGAQFHVGDIAQLVVYNRYMLQSEILSVESLLRAKWGV